MAKFNCCKCGKEADSSLYWRNAAVEMEEFQMCHECTFWMKKFLNDKSVYKDVFVIANGTHYIIGDEDSTDTFRGFDGAKVTIKFKDGRVVKSSNLWCQGDIPKSFRNVIPDNAEIIWSW